MTRRERGLLAYENSKIPFEKRFDWEAIQAEYRQDGRNLSKIGKKHGCHETSISKALKLGLLTKISRSKDRTSSETRKKISEKMKKWLRDNPNKHIWRRKRNYISQPCEVFKNYLRSKNIDFVAEYSPNIGDRNFSLDIAFPEKKIAIEINGNQHYNECGSLKEYYQQRHDLLVSDGWVVHEIHYSVCYSEEKLERIINNLTISQEFERHFPIKPEKPKNYCSCGEIIGKSSKECRACFHYKRRVIAWPTSSEMQLLLDNKPMASIAKTLGVSDNAVRKFCRRYGIWRKSSLIDLNN